MAISKIRKGTLNDVDEILRIFSSAKEYMKKTGNLTQWSGSYPDREIIEEDITNGTNYVGEDETGKIVMTFTFITGEDPTYLEIDGGWLNEKPYGTIHRIASDGSSRGVVKAACAHCYNIIDTIRIDTHEDNNPMQKALKELGFVYCGVIICRNGTPRMAFQSPES